MDDNLDTPTGIDWSEWNFTNEEIIKAVEANTAEIVVRQIMNDLKDEKPDLFRATDGDIKICIRLIDDTDAFVFFKVDDLHIAEDIEADEATAIIDALQRLIERLRTA